MDREQQRQRSINEHLLHQLISSKNKEAIFEKVMNLVLTFFQNSNINLEEPNDKPQEFLARKKSVPISSSEPLD